MDALRAISGFDSTQAMQGARAVQTVAAPNEQNGAQPLRPEQPGASVQVSLSEEARAVARLPSQSPPVPANTNTPAAAPVQTQEAVARAGSVESTGRAENQDAVAGARAGQEAVQRYAENAGNSLPAGQSAPSLVRVSA